jgi:hypothetical protein
MSENIELRKERAREFLKDAYSPKERKWYQTDWPKYKLITDGLRNNKNHPLIDEEIIIQNDLKGALLMSAFFVLVNVGIAIFQEKIESENFIIFGIWLVIFLAKGLDRRPKIILTKNSIWCNNFEEPIPWINIFAIYFKTEELSDSKNYSLLIHYYEEQYDYFKEIEFKLGDYKQSNDEIIAAIKSFS